jgi:hypothetical protein
MVDESVGYRSSIAHYYMQRMQYKTIARQVQAEGKRKKNKSQDGGQGGQRH